MNFKKKESELSKEEKRVRAAIILAIYAIFFIVLILFLFFTNPKNEAKDEKVDNNSKNNNNLNISNRLNKILATNNYEFNYTFANNYTLNGKVDDNTSLLIKSYNGNSTIYYVVDNIYYYEYKNDNFKKIDSLYLYEEYDDVFSNINNVILLFEDIENNTIKKENNFNVESFYVDLNKYFEIYNNIYLTNYKDNKNTSVYNEVKYNTDSMIIKLDLSEYYKHIYNKSGQVIYTFEFKNINKIKNNVILKKEE